jgi:hypothetical protein
VSRVTDTVAWAGRCANAAAAYPSVERPEFTRHLDAHPEIMGAIFRDILRFDNDRDPAGRRSTPELSHGIETLRELMGDRYSMDPFGFSLQRLAAGRSSAMLAARTGLSRSTIQRLRTGAMGPTKGHIEAVAAAFGKDPLWFVEYRAMLLAEMVAAEALRNPERSAAMVGKLR